MSRGTFPRNARDFMHAVEELFERQYPFFVLDHDEMDDTYLVAWVDGNAKQRKSWLTQTALDQLNEGRTLN